MLAAAKGYQCIVTLSEKMSFEKERVLTALGTRVVRTYPHGRDPRARASN